MNGTGAQTLDTEVTPTRRSIDKRIVIAIGLTLIVACGFWFGSRIPNLNEKAMMGGDSDLEPLGFDTVVVIEQHHSFVERVLYTTINWVDTNKRGMTFGVILAACFMTLLSLFQKKSFESGFANALMGTVIGVPLGVCVNCAAPIAKGLHDAGTRLETTLATMISSPTMNAIVLTMLFAMFPWYLIATKLALTVLFILVGIPLITRVYLNRQRRAALANAIPSLSEEVCELPPAGGVTCEINPGAQWGESFKWLVQVFPKNLWHIAKTTVPLMFLAGLLGSFMIQVLPWDSMAKVIPNIGSGGIYTVASMAFIAVIGTFLPVPIAFDVIVVAVLFAAGMPVKYAMVLLFTLGIYSVYSFQITWRYISRLVAVSMFVLVAAMGVGAGILAHYVSIWEEARQRQAMMEVFFNQAAPAAGADLDIPPGRDDTTLVAALQRTPVAFDSLTHVGTSDIEIESLGFRTRGDGGEGPMFERLDGSVVGIDEPSPFSLLRQLPPRYWGRGIATGDVHNDGWVDLLLAADNIAVKGISLYANEQGGGFVKQRVDVPSLNELEVLNAALVDINNDGWLDIFVSTYRGGNHILYNNDGRFTEEGLFSLPDNGAVLAASVAFGDVDSDSDLDIVLGNWSLGYFRGMLLYGGEPATSQNVLLIQEEGQFIAQELESFPGETLSSLLSDFNNDGHLDLIFGNDFKASDVYYLGDGKGGFVPIDASEGKLPYTPDSTMSIHTADINNDLVPEIFLTQIASGEGANFAEKMVPSDSICTDMEGKAALRCTDLLSLNADVDKSRGKRDAVRCLSIDDPKHREDCIALHVLWSAWMLEDKSFCELIPERRDGIAAICTEMFGEHIASSRKHAAASIPQIRAHNVLLVSDGSGAFTDQAVEMGISMTGWSWSGKFADVNNDEWQDTYVVNGLYARGRREPNFFFLNQNGERFEDRTEDSGLLDFRATGSYSYVDYDGDGDLDIISVPVNAPIRVFVNRSVQGNSFAVELRDEIGNRFGIGSKIIARYGPDGSRHQMREIQASGGFISFDAPSAHFGLGEHDSVTELEIRWSTGSTTRVPGPFAANARYVVTRRSGDTQATRIAQR